MTVAGRNRTCDAKSIGVKQRPQESIGFELMRAGLCQIAART